MPTVAAITAVVGTVYSVSKSEEAASQQRKATRTRNRQRQIAAARARRKSVAASLQERAQVTAEGAASGAIGSSAISGAQASLISQQAEALGFSTVQQTSGEEAAGFESAANRATQQVAVGQAVAALPSQVGLEPSFASVFEENPNATK